MAERVLLFSVTKGDCDWQYVRGRGKGGQKRNKTSSAVRCTHRNSGAVGYAEDGRSQLQNRKTAFRKMAESKKFKAWHRLEVSRKTGQEKIIQAAVDKAMREVRVEVKEDGKWIQG